MCICWSATYMNWTDVHRHTNTYACKYVCIYPYMCIWYLRMHICIYKYIYTYNQIYIYIHIRMYYDMCNIYMIIIYIYIPGDCFDIPRSPSQMIFHCKCPIHPDWNICQEAIDKTEPTENQLGTWGFWPWEESDWLEVEPYPSETMSSSVGMVNFPIGKTWKNNVPNHQPAADAHVPCGVNMKALQMHVETSKPEVFSGNSSGMESPSHTGHWWCCFTAESCWVPWFQRCSSWECTLW